MSRYTAEVWVSAVAKFFCKPTECYGGRKRDFCDFSRYFQRLKLQYARLYGPDKNRARIQKLSGTSADLLIDSCARTRASRTFDRAKRTIFGTISKKHKNNVIALEVAVRATEVLDLKVLKVKKCGIARRSVMIGGLRCVYCFIRFSSLDRTFLKQHFFPTAKRTLAIAVAITAPAIP